MTDEDAAHGAALLRFEGLSAPDGSSLTVLRAGLSRRILLRFAPPVLHGPGTAHLPLALDQSPERRSKRSTLGVSGMRVFIIDTRDVGPELHCGLIGVEGSSDPDVREKQECVETVSEYVTDGWAIAADPHTPIGWLAALTAETACVPFVNLARLAAGPRSQRESA
ncbi:hypothetical protein ACF1AJ_17595 [Leifsonia sp. NPDC014704]|uniref:hypothetical protein n=1 Tax=Leifsonia sp. NPDC014704 TaxID=3364123 RepID=UPI0036F48018